MDNNINSTFTSCEDDLWMDISSFLPISPEPFIQHDIQDIEMPTTPSYMDCGEGEKIFLAFPLAPPPPPYMPPTPPQSPPQVVVAAGHPSANAAAVVPSPASPKPKTRNRTKSVKEPKATASPKYKINPDDCATEKEKKSVLHAIKCKRGRLQKAQEKQTLVQSNEHLTKQVQILTEELRVVRAKKEALQLEVERRGQVIQALSWHAALDMCNNVKESQPQ